jgi:hypothetical protein
MDFGWVLNLLHLDSRHIGSIRTGKMTREELWFCTPKSRTCERVTSEVFD